MAELADLVPASKLGPEDRPGGRLATLRSLMFRAWVLDQVGAVRVALSPLAPRGGRCPDGRGQTEGAVVEVHDRGIAAERIHHRWIHRSS
jgi:hypothetical protein